jgi:hypothetical protein
MENQEIESEDPKGEKAGFLPFVLVFGGLIALLVIIK